MIDHFWNVFGIGLILIGSYALINSIIRLKKGIKIRGVVIKNINDWSLSGGSLKMMFYPLVRIKLKDAYKEIKLENGTNPPIYKEGSSIEVIYHDGMLYPIGLGWIIFDFGN